MMNNESGTFSPVFFCKKQKNINKSYRDRHTIYRQTKTALWLGNSGYRAFPFGGPDGELAASQRYLSQRYTMPYKEVIASLSDIGTEELGHVEVVSAIVHQLTRNLTEEEIKEGGFAPYFVDHGVGLYPVDASGVPFNAMVFQSKGDAITDLCEDMAAEQKARTMYDNLIRMTDDPDVLDPLKFLREREIVHFQRFGESLRIVQDNLDSRNFYAINPEFDK